MIVAVEQTTWDLIGQIGIWIVGFPIFLGVLGTYIAYQIAAERRANQRIEGRWGLAAQRSREQDD